MALRVHEHIRRSVRTRRLRPLSRPGIGGIFWDSVLANFIPGPQEIAVDYKNDARAPLLFISGSEDHLMPPAVQRSNAKHYKSNTITEIKEFPGRSHLMPAEQG